MDIVETYRQLYLLHNKNQFKLQLIPVNNQVEFIITFALGFDMNDIKLLSNLNFFTMWIVGYSNRQK